MSLAVIWKNPDSFEIIRKICSHLDNQDTFEIIRKVGIRLEKSGQFWNHPENWQSTGKIRTVLKSSRKLAVIWKNPDSFEIIRKIGSHLEESGSFWNYWDNLKGFFLLYTQKLSGRAKTFRMRKNFPGSNAILLPRFLRLCRIGALDKKGRFWYAKPGVLMCIFRIWFWKISGGFFRKVV